MSWLLAKCSEYFENAVSCRTTIDPTAEDTNFKLMDAYEKTKCLFFIAGTIHNHDFLKEHIFMSTISLLTDALSNVNN